MGGVVEGKLANGVGSQYSSHYLGTWYIQHYYHWYAQLGCQYSTELTPSGRFKWTRPFRRKTKSGFCACAITTQTQSTIFCSRVQLKCDGTLWHTGGEVKGKLANGVGSQYPSHYLGTWCIQHYYRWCAHLGWPVVDWTDAPCRFKWTRPFRGKTKIWFLRVCHHISTDLYTRKVYRGSESTAPFVLKLCIRWRWVLSFWPRPLYRRRKRSRYPLLRSLGGPQSRSGLLGVE